MKQGLSLRVSQHLALTPQLQQSIRLLQLSTMELAQEVEQMLDENPFLEVSSDEAREEFGSTEDGPRADDGEVTASPSLSSSGGDEGGDSDGPGVEVEAPNWEGDGSTE